MFLNILNNSLNIHRLLFLNPIFPPIRSRYHTWFIIPLTNLYHLPHHPLDTWQPNLHLLPPFLNPLLLHSPRHPRPLIPPLPRHYDTWYFKTGKVRDAIQGFVKDGFVTVAGGGEGVGLGGVGSTTQNAGEEVVLVVEVVGGHGVRVKGEGRGLGNHVDGG